MEELPSSYLRQLQGCLGDMTYELRIQYRSAAREQSWTPAINAYLCRDRIVVCVELAGVEKEQIELHAEPRRLLLRGARQPLERTLEGGPPLQLFALEIDQGLFQREIPLPLSIEPDAVHAEQRNGLLWVYLPLAHET
jgi:HSP20 family protein